MEFSFLIIGSETSFDVLVSMVSHVFSEVDILVSILSKIDALIIKFFWAKQGERGMHWVRKGILHKPKGMGGLGIHSLQVLYTSFRMKQVWRMHRNPNSLMSRIYTAKHPFSLNTSTQALLRGKVRGRVCVENWGWSQGYSGYREVGARLYSKLCFISYACTGCYLESHGLHIHPFLLLESSPDPAILRFQGC